MHDFGFSCSFTVSKNYQQPRAETGLVDLSTKLQMVTLITEEADALQNGTHIEREYTVLCRYIVCGSRGGAQNNQGGANKVQLSLKKS